MRQGEKRRGKGGREEGAGELGVTVWVCTTQPSQTCCNLTSKRLLFSLNGDSCCPEKNGLVFEIFLPLRKWVVMVEGYSYHGSGSQDKRKIADVDNEEKETR